MEKNNFVEQGPYLIGIHWSCQNCMIDFNYMYINCKASFGCDFKLDRSQVYQDAYFLSFGAVSRSFKFLRWVHIEVYTETNPFIIAWFMCKKWGELWFRLDYNHFNSNAN